MKKIIMAVVIISTVLFSCKGEKKEKIVVKEEVKVEKTGIVNNLDLAASVMTWKGTKPTGSHDGTAKNYKIGNKNIDMAGSEGAGKIEKHLKASDFFDVALYPTSKFVITSFMEVEGDMAVIGNLTIKDVTKSITIPASVTTVDGVTTFKSELFNIDRADFNVKYGSKRWIEGLKDKFIDDLVEMSFTVVSK